MADQMARGSCRVWQRSADTARWFGDMGAGRIVPTIPHRPNVSVMQGAELSPVYSCLPPPPFPGPEASSLEV